MKNIILNIIGSSLLAFGVYAFVVPFDIIDTTQTIEANNTGFVITGGDISSQAQIMPGGDTCSFNVNLPRNWDTLVANEGYSPIANYNLSE